MDEDRTHGAGAGGTLVLVGPAAVGHPLEAPEQSGIPVGSDVCALEVVPVFFRRRDAVPDKNDLSRFDRNGLFNNAGSPDVVVPELQLELSVGSPDRPGLGHLRSESHQLDRLFPAACAVTGLEAVALELFGQEGSRRVVALAGRGAAQERVVHPPADHGFQ